jgi:hypothetical protein
MHTTRKTLGLLLFVGMVGFFFYGQFRYPDAPIHPCGVNAYCGKQGQPRMPSEFRQLERWSNTLQWTWAASLIVVGLLRRGSSK